MGRRGRLRDTGKAGATGRRAYRNHSTGVGRKRDEPVSQTLGEIVEAVARPAGMTTYLALVEDQRQRVGQQPDHRQDYQSGALVDSGMFEVAVGGDGLKHL